MKFLAEPNLFVRFSNKYVQRSTSMKGIHFDAKGEYCTDKEILINLLSQHFKYEEIKTEPALKIVETKTESVEPNESFDHMTYAEMKSYAKSLGINTYGMKKEDIMTAILEAKHE